eukprot:414932_1
MNYSRSAKRRFRKKNQNNNNNHQQKPLSVEEELRKQNEQKNKRDRSAAIHELLDGVFNGSLLEIPFEERLHYRMISGRPAVRLNFNNRIGGGLFYLDDPDLYDKKFSNVIPIWGKLKVYTRGQDHKPFSDERTAEVILAWEDDEMDTAESGISTFIDFVLAMRELFFGGRRSGANGGHRIVL